MNTRHDETRTPLGPLMPPACHLTRTAFPSTAGTRAPAAGRQGEPDRIVIHADIHGADPKDIEARIGNGVLSIAGRRPYDSAASHAGHRRIQVMG